MDTTTTIITMTFSFAILAIIGIRFIVQLVERKMDKLLEKFDNVDKRFDTLERRLDDLEKEHIKIKQSVDFLAASVNNNIETKLYDALRDLVPISNNTEQERALWSYFNIKIGDVLRGYNIMKRHIVGEEVNEAALNGIEGSASFDLLRSKFNISHIDSSRIEAINKNSINDVKYKLHSLAMNSENGSKLELKELTNITLTAFKSNIRSIWHILSKYIDKEEDFEPTYDKVSKSEIINNVTINNS